MTHRFAATRSALVCLALSVPAFGQELPPKPPMQLEVPPIDATAQVGMFPSGLQVMASLDESTTEVAATFVIDAGWSKDPADARGMSLLFERLWWRSEVAPGVRVVDALAQTYGCEVDSLVNPDVIRFTSVCPRATIDAAMRVWSRLFTDPLAGLSDTAIAEEAAAFRTDAAVRARLADQQLSLLAPPLYAQLYPAGHPNHLPADLNLAAIPFARVKDWAFKTILPAFTTAAVMGGYSSDHWMHGPALVTGNFAPKLIDPRLTPAMIQRWPLGDAEEVDADDPSASWGWPQDPSTEDEPLSFDKGRPGIARLKPAPDAPAPTSAPFLKVTGTYTEPLVMVGWSIPGSWRDDEVLHTVVANTVASIVAKHLDEPAIDRLLGCYVLPGLEGAVLTCAAQLKPGQASGGERIGNRIVDQLSYIADVNNRPEVETAIGLSQNGALSAGISQLDALSGVLGSRSYWVSSGTHLVGDPLFWSKRLQGISKITTDNVLDFVAKYITRTRSRIVQIEPDATVAATPTLRAPDPAQLDAVAELPSYWTLAAAQGGVPAMAASRATPARIARDLGNIDLAAARTGTLANGLDVILLPQGASPIAHARLIGPMGTLNDPTDHHAYTYARAMMTTHRESAEAIAGTWYSWLGETSQVFGLRGSSSNLSQLMFLLRDGADSMNPTTKNKVSWTADTRRGFLRDIYDPMWHIDAARRAHTFAGSPLGTSVTWDDVLSWDGLDADVPRDMMRAQWNPSAATLVVVGGFDEPETAWEKIDAWWSGWKVAAPEVPYVPAALPAAPLPTAPRVEIYTAGPERPTAEIVMSCRVQGSHETALAAASWMRLGLPDSLTSAIVDAESWSPENHLVTVRARVATGSAGAATRALLARAGAAGSAPTDQVALAAWQAATELGEPFSAARDAVAAVTELVATGRTLADRAAGASALSTLTPAALGAALAPCGSGAYVALVGDEATLTPSATAAGLSPASVDWRGAAARDHARIDPKGYEKLQKKP